MQTFYSCRSLPGNSRRKRWTGNALLLLLCLATGWLSANAQPNITRVEYYIDTDPGIGSATSLSITPGPDLANLNIAIDPATVAEGVHRLFVRAQDAAGKWSLTNTWLFYKPYGSGGSVPALNPPTNITLLEYYIDNDPGFGAGIALGITPGTDIQDAIIAVNPATVAEGVHRLFVRAQNASGAWSLTNTWLFYKPYGSNGSVPPLPAPANIALMEYYIDTDPGYGSATPVAITPGTDLADVVVSLNPATLSEGVHRFNVRAKDADGKWSLTNTWIFYKPYSGSTATPALAKMKKLEYYIDTDPGYGSGVPVALDSLTDFSDYVMPINVTGLSAGTHNLWVRGQDMQGKWSMMNKWLFSVSATIATPAIVANSITRKTGCARDSFDVSYDRTGTYNTGNQFKVELSDASGSFASPIIIGSYTGTDNAIIRAALPSHLPDGAFYRVRVSSTSPAVTGVTGKDSITLHDRPYAQTITGLTQVNGTFTQPYTVPTATGSNWNWLVTGGTQSSGGTTNSINIGWSQPGTPSVAGKINVIEANQYGCTGDTSTLALTIYKLRIGNTVATSACKGFGVTIGVNADGAYYSGNTYTAQLSDASGSFVSPAAIGSITLTGNGVGQTASIAAIIPQGIPNGTGYKIRIISSSPAFTGDTSAAISIIRPDVGADITRSKCPGFGYDLRQNYTDATLTYVYYTTTFGTLARPDSVDAGTYQVIATNSIGCRDTATITITNYPKPDLGPDKTISKCPGETVDLNSLFTLTGLTTSWTTATPSAQLLPGTFRLIVTNSNGCMDTAFVTVSNYPKPDIGADKTVSKCASDAVDLTAQFNTTGLTTSWNTANPAMVYTTGTYTLIVTNSNGCKDTAQVVVSNYPKPDLGPDKTVSKCSGDAVDLTTLFSTTGLTVSWNVANPAAVYTSGIYMLIATNNNGCKDTALVTVSNYPRPDLGPDKTVTTACPGGTYDLTTVFTTTGLTTNWSTTTPTAAPAGTYQLIVTNSNGCKDTASVTVNNTPITDVPTIANTKTANRECTTADGWTHYYYDNNTPADPTDDIRLLSLKKNGQAIGTIGDGTFQVKVAATAGAGSNTAVMVSNSLITNALWSMNRYWSVTPTTQPTSNNIGVRFYYNTQDLADVNGSYPNGPVSHTQLVLYKTNGNPDPTSNFAGATQIKSWLNGSTPSTSNWVYTSLGNGIHQAEFQVTEFSGGGAGATQTGGSLPISLLRFAATGKDYTAYLNWSTSSETNSLRFVVARSFDGSNFTPIGSVNAAGQSTTTRTYSFTDNLATILTGPATVYYRLQLVDYNGSQTGSPIVAVKLGDAKAALSLLYNPVQSEAVLQYQSLRSETIAIRLIDATGRTLLQLNKTASAGGNQYRLPTSALAKGIYKIVLTGSGQPLAVSMMKE